MSLRPVLAVGLADLAARLAPHVTPASIGAVADGDPRLLDTGWRDVTDLIQPGILHATTPGRLLMHRIGDRVTMRFDNLKPVGTLPAPVHLINDAPLIPVGFRPGSQHVQGFATRLNAITTRYDMTLWSSTRLSTYGRTSLTSESGARVAEWTDADTLVGEMTWTTDDPWPTTLPGAPAA